MKSSLLPLSSVPAEAARDFLRRRGFSPEVIQWKYFDEEFNGGRERAFVWFHQDRVKGFIGIIPFQVGLRGLKKEMVWTCDWSVEDSEKSPGVGVKLLKKVHANYDYVGGVGGSDFTHALLPRMASHMAEDAAIFFHRPIRLGYLLEKLEARVPRLPKFSRTWLSKVSWRSSGNSGFGSATIQRGVSKFLEPLFYEPASDHFRPLYDHKYLDWQVGRSPGIQSFSCMVGEPSAPDAVALFWSARREPRYWRVVLRARPGALAELRLVLAAVVQKVHSEKAWALSTIASHLDGSMLPFLRSHGFIRGPVQWPLYLFSSEREGPPVPDLAHLSYLDTDLATAF